MRTLVIMRHANAAWGSNYGDDHGRPLDSRGHAEADAAGARFAAADLVPDLVCCSSATRTRETLERVLACLDRSPTVRFDDELYGASAGMLLATARATEDEYRRVLLVAHNPGVSEFVGHFRGRRRTLIPTSGVAWFEFDVDSWRAVDEDSPARCRGLWI